MCGYVMYVVQKWYTVRHIYIYKKYIMMRIKNRTDINLYPCRCQIVFVCVVIFFYKCMNKHNCFLFRTSCQWVEGKNILIKTAFSFNNNYNKKKKTSK